MCVFMDRKCYVHVEIHTGIVCLDNQYVIYRYIYSAC